jgi:hypothetical protein
MTGSFAALPANAGPRNTGSFQALPPSAGMMPSSARPGVTPAADVNAARATLETLRQELDGTRELDELQYKLDGVQKRIFDLGGQVREADRLRQELAQAQAAVEAAPSPSKLGLPENIAERASKVEVLEKQRDDQLKRLEREREQFLGKSFSVDPLYRDQAFLAAMGVGALTLVLGLALGHAWRYLSLLDIPAFGMGAVLAIRWIGEVQANQSLGRRKAHYDEREKQIQDAFENEVLSVKTAMKLLGVESPGELVDIFAARQVQERQAQEAAQRLAELESNPAVQMAKQQVAEAQAEQSQFEARIGELSSYGRPPHVIEAEIEELEASIQAALAPPAPAPAPTAAPVTAATPAATAPGTPTPPGEDPVPRLLDATTDLFGADLATLAGLIAPRAAQYLAALTERRLSTLEIDAKGQAQVGSAQGKQGAGALPPGDRDLVYLAVKVALMEKYAERARLPYLIDDDFSGFPPAQVALIARVLKHLGTRAQVLHLSASPATEAAADARYAV